ncbi:MAG: dephospho-CoA kinase [Treponema sp.]|jgi:dephospho-CoA kinase|nr:dephospho-CoA kinase [Treponema sp.]
MLIGLTGMYCAGKNFVGSLLEARGLPVLDVDKLGYLVLEDEKERIFAEFGDDLANKDGSLNRRLLGEKVFGSPGKLVLLESIVHPPVNRLVDEWIAVRTGSCVINAALLHKSAVFNRLDRVILVTAPYLTRFVRAKRRDGLPFQAVFKRLGSQGKFNSQYLLSNAEIYRVENPGLSGAKRLVKKLEEFIDQSRNDRTINL